MLRRLIRYFRKRRGSRSWNKDVDPDEIFLDSSNIPSFDRDQFEGRIETPIARRYLITLSILFSLVALVYAGRSFSLQIMDGEFYYNLSLIHI